MKKKPKKYAKPKGFAKGVAAGHKKPKKKSNTQTGRHTPFLR